MRIYKSLKPHLREDRCIITDVHLIPEAPVLVGYMCGNYPQLGCLTSDPNVRLHSCEKGNMCRVAKGRHVVQLQPIVAHVSGCGDLKEAGVGGGGDDLEREAEMDWISKEELEQVANM